MRAFKITAIVMVVLLVGCAQFTLVPNPTAQYIQWQPTEGEPVLVPPIFKPPPINSLQRYVPGNLGAAFGDNGEALVVKIFTMDARACMAGPCEFGYSEAWEVEEPHRLYGMCTRVNQEWVCVRRDDTAPNVFHLRIRE